MKQKQPHLKTAQQYYDRAREHFYEDELDKAEVDCTEAILRDEKFRQAWVLRGDIYSEMEKYDLAVENFKQGLHLLSAEARFFMPGDAPYREAQILCRIATANLAQGNLEDALRNSKKSAELADNYTMVKNFSEPWYIQGMAWLKKGSDNDALLCFNEAAIRGVYRDYYYMSSLLERARILRKLWKIDDALSDCNEIIRQEPYHADALVERIHCRIAENFKSNEDVEYLRNAVQISPKHSEAWAMLAFYLSASGRIEEAGEAAAKALELNSGDEERVGRLGDIVKEARRKKEARKKALRNYHTFVHSYPDAKIHSHEKGAPIAEEEFDEAVTKMSRSLLFDPNDVAGLSKRAAAWIGKGNLEKAMEDSNKLVELHPGNADFLKRTALVDFLGS